AHLPGQKSALPLELAVLFEGRYKAINNLINQFTPSQILELASGFSARGMEFSHNPKITFVESDLPRIIAQKQKLVEQLVGQRSNLHAVAIDITQNPSQFPLDVNYLQPEKPIVITCEGVLLYLTLEQKQQVFVNVRQMLEIYDGVWITSDLITLETHKKRQQVNPNWSNFSKLINSMTGRTPSKNYFKNWNHIEQFCQQQGFHVEKYKMLDVVTQLSCLEPLGISVEVAESVLEDSFIFALMPDYT
ncbi:MAG: class I SAM-dependent methyltransferase, partial [Xenococcus sp. (in: cyanobacteria)]